MFFLATVLALVSFEGGGEKYSGPFQPALNPKVAQFLVGQKPIDYSLIPKDVLRAGFEERMGKIKKLDESVHQVVDKTIGESLHVRFYTSDSKELKAIMLYFHGGGFVVGSCATCDDVCRSIAHRSGCIVASVEYRLAPEHKFPAALEDAYTALQWVASHGKEVGADVNKIVVAGDSAGGNIAAALSLYARDHQGPKIAHQVLIYPGTNYNFNTLSYFQNEEGYRLTRAHMKLFWDYYLKSPEDGLNPYASPLVATSFKDLPPALVITAHYDVLRDDGESYAARLESAGVKAKVVRYLDMIHGFINYAAEYSSAQHALDLIATTLRQL